jgi:hypothetical protein
MATEAAWLECKESTGRKEKKKKRKKNILIRKKKKNILDTHRPSHGRSWLTRIIPIDPRSVNSGHSFVFEVSQHAFLRFQ